MHPTGKLKAVVILSLCCVLSAGPAVRGDELPGRQTWSGQATQNLADVILPADEAFRFGVVPGEASTTVFWQVMPGYFLYRDKISFEASGVKFDVELPVGEFRDDETFGYVQVLEGLVQLDISGEMAFVSVHYQGCAAKGFCYPPQEKQLNSENMQLIPNN